MWRDLFELNIALREASRVYTDPAIFSAIEKIERATSAPVQIEIVQRGPHRPSGTGNRDPRANQDRVHLGDG